MFKKKSFKRLLGVLWGAIMLSIFFRITVVEGNSMLPTYTSGEIHLVSSFCKFLGYSPGDCVLFRYEDKIYLKRVLWIEPNGDLYVLGDNEDDSFDSRDFGPIRQSTVIGTIFI